jgi:hypothetical protein
MTCDWRKVMAVRKIAFLKRMAEPSFHAAVENFPDPNNLYSTVFCQRAGLHRSLVGGVKRREGGWCHNYFAQSFADKTFFYHWPRPGGDDGCKGTYSAGQRVAPRRVTKIRGPWADDVATRIHFRFHCDSVRLHQQAHANTTDQLPDWIARLNLTDRSP